MYFACCAALHRTSTEPEGCARLADGMDGTGLAITCATCRAMHTLAHAGAPALSRQRSAPSHTRSHTHTHTPCSVFWRPCSMPRIPLCAVINAKVSPRRTACPCACPHSKLHRASHSVSATLPLLACCYCRCCCVPHCLWAMGSAHFRPLPPVFPFRVVSSAAPPLPPPRLPSLPPPHAFTKHTRTAGRGWLGLVTAASGGPCLPEAPWLRRPPPQRPETRDDAGRSANEKLGLRRESGGRAGTMSTSSVSSVAAAPAAFMSTSSSLPPPLMPSSLLSEPLSTSEGGRPQKGEEGAPWGSEPSGALASRLPRSNEWAGKLRDSWGAARG